MTAAIGTARLKTCFISAPAGAPLKTLRSALESRAIRVLVPQDLEVGSDLASEIQKQISLADLIIGILTSDRQSRGVLFQLGQAYALGRRIVIITRPKSGPLPFTLHQVLVLRIDLRNRDAIGFALDRLLSAPDHQSERIAISQRKELAGLGAKADFLLSTLNRSLVASDRRAVQNVVEDVLRSSGVDVVVTSPSSDTGADFAIWSDVLEPFVGNPLLVEIKGSIRGKNEAKRALRQLSSYLDASSSRWGLLLYGEGDPDTERRLWSGGPPNVLVLSLRSLIESLRTRAFPELIRDLRNLRVHGSSS
jgi:hypothetical protein